METEWLHIGLHFGLGFFGAAGVFHCLLPSSCGASARACDGGDWLTEQLEQ